MTRWLRAAIVSMGVSALCTASGVARAGEASELSLPTELVVAADPKLSMDVGIITLRRLSLFAFQYELALPSAKVRGRPHTTFALNLLGRLAEEVFIAAPLVEAEVGTLHEVFGHGARGRELGLEPIYQFSLPQPYRAIFSPDDHADHSAFTQFQATHPPQQDRDLATSLAGIEANLRTAHLVQADMVKHDGVVHHADLLAYFGKLVYSSSVYDPRVLSKTGFDGGNDVSSYVTLLADRFNRFRPEERTAIAKRLQTAYIWNFMDPTLGLAAYATVRRVVLGDRYVQAPLPHILGATVYAAPRFNLSPFGAEHYIDVFMARGGALLDVYGRVGSSGLASYTGGGVHLTDVAVSRRVRLGAELDLWSQPETLLDVRNAYVRPQVFGASGGVTGAVSIGAGFGAMGKLAYKSAGYLQGQPLDEGVYGYAGLTYRP